MTPPILQRGVPAIAAHLALGRGEVAHLDRQRHLPTFRLPGDGEPHATAGGLDEWVQVSGRPPAG